MATPTQQPVVQKEQSMAMYDGESQQMGVGMMVTGPHKGQYSRTLAARWGLFKVQLVKDSDEQGHTQTYSYQEV